MSVIALGLETDENDQAGLQEGLAELAADLYRLAMPSDRYPEAGAMFRAQTVEADTKFAAAREDFLLNYGHQTARAYWGDLQDIHDWCVFRQFNILTITDDEFAQYVALLRRRKYSENTIRRRRTAWRGFTTHARRRE